MKFSDFFDNSNKVFVRLHHFQIRCKDITEKVINKYKYCSYVKRGFISAFEKYYGYVYERVFAFRFIKGNIQVQEVCIRTEGTNYCLCRNMYFTYMGGYNVIWKKEQRSYYFYEEDFNVWCESSGWNMYPISYFNSPEDVDDSLKYSCTKGSGFLAYEWITIYRLYPEIELLAKINQAQYFKNTRFLKLLKERDFKKFLIKNLKFLQYGSSSEVLSAYKKKLYVNEYIVQKNLNSSINLILKEFDFLEPFKERLKKYLIMHNDDPNFKFSYIDHIKCIEFLKLDLKDTKNIFPNDFEYWHNYYVNKKEISYNESINNAIASVVKKYKKFEFNVEVYNVSLAKSTFDLINEGEYLHHCVGRMNYSEKIANESSLIVFVRLDKNIPLYTMEYDIKSKKILQFYGDHDSTVPNDVVNLIKNNWLERISKIRIKQLAV